MISAPTSEASVERRRWTARRAAGPAISLSDPHLQSSYRILGTAMLLRDRGSGLSNIAIAGCGPSLHLPPRAARVCCVKLTCNIHLYIDENCEKLVTIKRKRMAVNSFVGRKPQCSSSNTTKTSGCFDFRWIFHRLKFWPPQYEPRHPRCCKNFVINPGKLI